MSLKLLRSRNFFFWIGLAFITVFWFGFEYLPLSLLKFIFFCSFIAGIFHVFPSSRLWLEKLLNKGDSD